MLQELIRTRDAAWTQDERRAVGRLMDDVAAGLPPTDRQRVALEAVRSAQRRPLHLLRQAGLDSGHAAAGVRSPSGSGGLTSVIIKPVGDVCNLRCTYCYEMDEGLRKHLPRMSVDTLEAIIRDILAQTGTRPIQFLWHGGEPTLAGIEFFRLGMELQARHNLRNAPISNSMQTNGTLLNDHWIQFFQEHRFAVGVSLDGPDWIHDYYRVGPGGKGSYAQVVAGIEQLRRGGIPFGGIIVVTEESSAHAAEVFQTMADCGVTSFDAHPSFGTVGPDTESTTRLEPALRVLGTPRPKAEPARPLAPALYARFMIDLFEAWLASGREDIRVLFFDDVFTALLGQQPHTCYFAGLCSNIMGFDPNGDALPCTRPFDRDRYTFGNIRESSLMQILSGSTFTQFKAEDLAGQAKAQPCRWYSMCRNGCPQHRVEDGKQSVSGGNIYCQCQSGIPGGFAAIYEHMVNRINELLQVSG